MPKQQQLHVQIPRCEFLESGNLDTVEGEDGDELGDSGVIGIDEGGEDGVLDGLNVETDRTGALKRVRGEKIAGAEVVEEAVGFGSPLINDSPEFLLLLIELRCHGILGFRVFLFLSQSLNLDEFLARAKARSERKREAAIRQLFRLSSSGGLRPCR